MTRTWTQRDGMRFLYLALAFAVVIAALAVLPATPARAAVNGVGGAMIVSDGDTIGPDDWTSTPGIIVINDADQELIPAAAADGNGIITATPNEICTTGTDLSIAGSKINTPLVTIDPDGSDGYPTPQPTGKTDLCQLYLGFEDTGSAIILNVGVVKYKSQGDLSVFVELSQGTGVVAASFRQAGDVLLEFDWDGGSGGANDVTEYTWDGFEWILAPGTLPVDGGSAAPNRVFGEAAVNISSLFPAPTSPDACERFGAATLWGKTGNSLTASLKDVIGPGPIDLSNCGTLVIEKETLPTGATGTFLYSVESTDFPAWDPTDPDGTSDPTLTEDGDSDTYLLVPGEYTVAELEGTLAAQGFDFSSYTINCGDGDGVANVVAGEVETCTITNVKFPTLTLEKTVVNDDGGTAVKTDFQASVSGVGDVDWDATTVLTVGSFTAAETATVPGYAASAWGGDCAADGSISLIMGQNATCTITNDDIAPTLVLEKTVINDDGGTAVETDFQASVSVHGDVDWGAVTELSAGDYTAAEETVAGYAASVWGGDCAAGGSITLALGDTATCTITNDDIAPKLTLVKLLDIRWGGDATLADFLLSADGPDANDISGYTGDASITAAEVFAGTYALDEDGPIGYLGQGWACIGGTQDGSSVTLEVGEEATCTVTNGDEPGQIIVVKEVVNDDGGTLGAGDFNLTLDGTAVVSGGVNNVFTNISHTAAETAIPVGYEWVSTSCVITGTDTPIGSAGVVTVAEGQSATCTITNDDIAPTLTLEKTVVNDDGGLAVEADFQASVSDAAVAWDAVTEFLPGSYTAAEGTVTGYAASVWGGDCAEDGSITLALGDTATCTITNDDIAPTLTLEKTVVNDDGGLAVEADFQASVSDAAVAWDAVTVLSAGSYTAAESNLDGYAASVWGGDCAADGSITLSLAQDATCTITNDDIAPRLTLVKEVVNDDGGDAVAADWALTANDGGDGADLSGAGGDSGDVLANAPYILGEAGGPAGYSTEGYSCAGDGIVSSDADSVTLALGADVTCTIINDDLPSSVTVVKDFEHETNVDPDAFNLTVSDGDSAVGVLSGEANAFDANATYTVGETVLAGWTQTSLVCRIGEEVIGNGFELALNEHVVCTITNGENPTVTVSKVTDIATEDLFDFFLNQDKQSVASGGSYTWEDLTPGDFTLVEVLSSEAWALEGYECNVEAADLGNGVGFGLSWGDHVTCEFGNEIVPIDIQVEKSDRVDPIVLTDADPVGLIEYDIVVTNNGPAADPGVTLVDTLPLSLTFVSVVTDTGTCGYVLADHTIECDFGALDVGDVVNIYVVMETETLGSVTDIFPLNTTTVSGIREDFDLSNNTDDEVTTIIEVEALCDDASTDPDCLPVTGADIEGPIAAGLVFLLLGSLLAILARKEDEGVATA